MMPLEIGWSATVSWRAGDEMCRIMAFFRVFGLFLSSFILVCISIDRYESHKKKLIIVFVTIIYRLVIYGFFLNLITKEAV